MRRILIFVMLCLLGGCVSVTEVHTGENKVGDRMTVNIEGPWNQLNLPDQGPAQKWTMEGMTVDELLVYSGIKEGTAINPKGKGGEAKDFVFHAKMTPNEIVGLFEGMLTKDGSTFKLTKLEPQPFGGVPGFHFEYVVTRKIDNVQLAGLGYGAVSNGELFALLYGAPRLTFFPRHKATVEQIAQSARIN